MADSESARQAALKLYANTIKNCQKMVPKFAPGTAQATLLTHRIAALRVLIQVVSGAGYQLPRPDLLAAVAPIKSIIHKTTVARAKYGPEAAMYRRLTPMIDAMTLGLTALQEQMEEQDHA